MATKKPTEPDVKETKPPKINLKDDLWKYALLIMVQKTDMEIAKTDLIAELPNYISIPDRTEVPNDSRSYSKFSQLVSNLKSH